MGKTQHRFIDFWLLGGASIVIWAILAVSEYFRDIPLVYMKFQMMPATLGLLAILCNHPHFLASYKLAYGRGLKFCLKNWLATILVPVLLIILYAVAFLGMQERVSEQSWIIPLNTALGSVGLGFRFGETYNLGTEILGVTIWLMYFTVGWHYSKQVFGCMMVYAAYDKYKLTPLQRGLIKASLFSIAFYSFCQIAIHWQDYFGYGPFSYSGMLVTPLGLPQVLSKVALGMLVVASSSVVLLVFVKKFFESGQRPSLNLLVSYLAFHVWWVPLSHQREFYFMMVPFFHSLQYLVFAYRMESGGTKSPVPAHRLALSVAGIVIIGFLSFELIPYLLDEKLSTGELGVASFFAIAIPVFINIHHFFLDSVLWRFQDSRVQSSLFSPDDPRFAKID